MNWWEAIFNPVKFANDQHQAIMGGMARILQIGLGILLLLIGVAFVIASAKGVGKVIEIAKNVTPQGRAVSAVEGIASA